jgi:hypothetical protein
MTVRTVGPTFITSGSVPGTGPGSGSTVTATNVLVFSTDPEPGEVGQIGPQGLRGETGAPGSGGSGGAGVPFFAEQYVEETSFLPGPTGAAGAAGATGSQGIQGNTTFVLPGDDPEESISLPGPQGIAGTPGAAGIPGSIAFILAGDDPEESISLPGPRGTDGIIGSNGAPGIAGPAFAILPDDPEEGMIGPVGPRGATGAPGGGGGSATTVEVNLSATAICCGRFTITDAAITATSKVLCWQAPGPYTGKGTRADEAEMQPVQIIAVNPAAGSAVAYWQTPPMIVTTVDAAYRGLPLPTNTKDAAGWIRHTAFRRGKVRGNVKFSYLAFS